MHRSDNRSNSTHLEYGGYDWSDKWEELVGEYNREVDEHHNVAVTDVWSDVGTTGCLHDVRHQRVKFLNTQTSDHLTETYIRPSLSSSV